MGYRTTHHHVHMKYTMIILVNLVWSKAIVNCLRVLCQYFQPKLIKEQKFEVKQCFEYLAKPKHAPLPRRETIQSASNFFLVDGVLYRSYLPGHLRKRSSFRDKLVPKTLRLLVISASHDLPASGGHLAFKATFDRVRDR